MGIDGSMGAPLGSAHIELVVGGRGEGGGGGDVRMAAAAGFERVAVQPLILRGPYEQRGWVWGGCGGETAVSGGSGSIGAHVLQVYTVLRPPPLPPPVGPLQ